MFVIFRFYRDIRMNMLSLNLLVAFANLVFRIMLKFFKILEEESSTKRPHTELKCAN